MNILVTGGSGFIGTRLVTKLLEEKHTVKIFDKAPSATYPELVVIGDVRDKTALTEASKGMDVIYNLAAEHADNVTPRSLYADVNIGGAENVVAAARENGIKRIVFTSSVAIYGREQLAPDESSEARPSSEYGRTKYEAEKIFLEWVKEDPDNALTTVRPSVVFGEKNRGNVYRLMKQIADNKFVMVGSGKNRKSMSYVGNISIFLASVTNAGPGVHIYNFAGKPDLTSKQIVEIIRDELHIGHKIPQVPYWIGLLGGYFFDLLSKLTGKKFPVSSVRIEKFNAETVVSTEKLVDSGFKESYGLEEALRRTIRYEFSQQ
jgi:nucleoside-diphosphate-sugar epimerase